jgi:hypothetical protein
VAPQGTDAVLTADVPDVHVEALVLDCLDIETDRRNRGDVLAKLQFVQHRSLPGGVQAQHQAPRLTVLEPFLEDPRKPPKKLVGHTLSKLPRDWAPRSPTAGNAAEQFNHYENLLQDHNPQHGSSDSHTAQ